GEVVKNNVVQITLATFRVIEVEESFLLRRYQAIVTVGLYRDLTGTTGDRNTAPAREMIPDNLPGLFFIGAVQYRERVTPKGAVQPLGLTNNFGVDGVLAGIVRHPVRYRMGTA